MATYRILQHRMTVAAKHLAQEINALMWMHEAKDQMSISSYESTKGSLWSIFGNGLARKEVGKLLARPEYFNKMPEDLIEIAAYLHKRAYKESQSPKEFTINCSWGACDQEKVESNITRNSATPTTGPNFVWIPTASKGQSVRFAAEPPVPGSISVLLSKRHAVTRLPGAGAIGVPAVHASSVKTTMALIQLLGVLTIIILEHLLRSVRAYPALSWGLAMSSGIGTTRMKLNWVNKAMEIPTEEEFSPQAPKDPLPMDLPPPVTMEIPERKVALVDALCQTPGTFPLKTVEMGVVVEEEEEEVAEEVAERETMAIQSCKTLTFFLGGKLQKNGSWTVSSTLVYYPNWMELGDSYRLPKWHGFLAGLSSKMKERIAQLAPFK